MKEKNEKLPEEENGKEQSGVSRRDFLVGAGTVVVGGAIGAGLLSSCGEGETVTTTVEKTKTVTTTLGGTGGATVTKTETVAGPGGEVVTVTKMTTVEGPGGAVEPWQEPEETFIKGIGFSGSDTSVCDVKNGKVIRIRPLHYTWKYTEEELAPAHWQFTSRGKTFKSSSKTMPNYFNFGYKKRIYSPNRVRYPLQRIDWDPNADPTTGRNTQNRGVSKYKRISWDDAFDIIANEIKRVQQTYGPLAICAIGQDGHHENKNLHACGGCQSLLLQNAGGFTQEIRNPDSWEGWYWGAKFVWGEGRLGLAMPNDNILTDISDNCDYIMWWAGDWETTPTGAYGFFNGKLLLWFQELGIKSVYIDPVMTYAAAVRADKWIPILPNTDAAMMLAIIYTWAKEDIYDKEYVATHVIGWEADKMPEGADPKDNFKDYVLGTYDGVPKTPEWASAKCGVPVCTIKALARVWMKYRTSIGHANGGSTIRGPYSHEPARLLACLMGLSGHGKPGRQQTMTSMGSTGAPPKSVTVRAPIGRALSALITPQIIPRTLVQHAILNPPQYFYGSTALMAIAADQFIKYTYPIPEDHGGSELHMLWSEKPNNTVNWNDGFSFIQAVRSPKIECYISQQQWMEDDCLFSDIVLPITTNFEDEDMVGTGRELALIGYQKRAIKPIGESKSDYEIACGVAERLGPEVLTAVSENRTIQGWMEHGFKNSGVPDMTWEEFQEKLYYIPPVRPDWHEMTPGLRGFAEDPATAPLTTPSGLFEFYSDRLANGFPEEETLMRKERPAYPQWIVGGPGWTHDESLEGERCKDYPLLCVSNHPRWRFHSECDDITWIREIPTCKMKGPDGYAYEPLWIHPTTANERGIKHGDLVKIFNERGTVIGAAYVTERMIPCAVSQDHGPKVDLITDKLDRGGSNNLISPSMGISKNVWGMASSGFLVEVKKLDPAEMEQWRQQYPEAFARPYDPSYGNKLSAWVEGVI